MSMVKGKMVKMEIIQVGEYEYTKQDIIGHGAFAIVYKGRKRKVWYFRSLSVLLFIYLLFFRFVYEVIYVLCTYLPILLQCLNKCVGVIMYLPTYDDMSFNYHFEKNNVFCTFRLFNKSYVSNLSEH